MSMDNAAFRKMLSATVSGSRVTAHQHAARLCQPCVLVQCALADNVAYV